MIKVFTNELLNFSNIDDFYKWLLKNKNIDIEYIEGSKEAECLYSFLKFYNKEKEKLNNEIVKINDTFTDQLDNDIVKEAVEELKRMNNDGKFLRALLISLGYNSFIEGDYYLPLALAYEVFQTSILIHDDIIDNAKLRRGKTTIPESYKKRFLKYSGLEKDFDVKSKHIANSLGICIGDLGFYFTNKIIIDNYSKSDNFSELMDLYNKIVINTIKGEIIDVLLPFKEQYSKDIVTSMDAVMEIYRLKTAWYSIIGPYFLGMTLAKRNSEEISKMESILYKLGIAFQIKDDIFGIFGSEDELGKTSSDISEFKQTILYAYLVENDLDTLKKISNYYGKSNLTKKDIEAVQNMFIKSGALEYAEEKMHIMFNDSKKELESISFIPEKYKKILFGFITYLNLRTK